jgi:hypothetical protein
MNLLLNNSYIDLLLHNLTELHIWYFIWYLSFLYIQIMLVKLLSSMIFHNVDASQHNETIYMHKFMSLLLYALWFAISPLICFSFILRPWSILVNYQSLLIHVIKPSLRSNHNHSLYLILLIFSLLIWVWYDAMKPIQNPSKSLVIYFFQNPLGGIDALSLF